MSAARQPPRPAVPRRGLAVGLALFSAVSAVGGGGELIAWPYGNPYSPPVDVLAHTPFHSFLVPGLILAIAVGGTSLACALLVWRRSRAAVDATVLAGGVLSVWIAAEVAMLRDLHWLHVVYGALGVAILTLGAAGAWRSPHPRHRWLIAVTGSEALGFLAPACAGVALGTAGVAGVPLAAVMTVAGMVEGAALGAGQAWAFPLPIDRLRYIGLTAVGAGVVWASVMTAGLVATSDGVSLALAVVVCAAAGVVGLLGIGGAQWLELRRHTPRATPWVGWTALAWVCALPASFAAGPFVDESTPLAAHVALWGASGLVMAYVMALITWRGARRLSAGRARPG